MAPLISLTDGTVTYQLNSTTRLTTNYPLSMATLRHKNVEAGRDKQNLSITGYQNVTETLELLITSSTAANLQIDTQRIEKLLDKARQSVRTWEDTRIYIQVQHDGDTQTWRSEILAAHMEYTEPLDQIAKLAVECRLTITRRPFWEGARTALELSTEADATPATSEVTLHVTDDATAGERNYIDIASTEIDGNIPAPIELQLRNAEAGAKDWNNYYLGNFVHMDPENVDPIYVGSASLAAPGATETWTADTETITHRWAISDTQAGYFGGQYVRMLAIVTSALTECYARAGVTYGSASPIAIYKAGQQTFLDGTGIYDLGVVPLPPGGASTQWSDISAAIYCQAEGGSTLTIDHIQLFPAGEGLFRKIHQIGFTVPNTAAMVEDGPEGLVYVRTTATGYRAPVLRGYYEPLHIWPGVTNRIRVYIDGATKGDQLEAQAWYRPRRLAI